jgi:hypothetical protein
MRFSTCGGVFFYHCLTYDPERRARHAQCGEEAGYQRRQQTVHRQTGYESVARRDPLVYIYIHDQKINNIANLIQGIRLPGSK